MFTIHAYSKCFLANRQRVYKDGAKTVKGGKFRKKKEALMGHLRHSTVNKRLFKPRNTQHTHTLKSQATFRQALSFSTTVRVEFG